MTGLFYEEFQIGAVFEHAIRRTITEMDNVLFSSLTLNHAALHLDAHYAKSTVYGQPVVNSIFTLGLICGISVADTTQGTAVANLGFEEVKFPHPVFHGDTIRARTEILGKRPSQSRPGSGIVFFLHEGINQKEEVVCEAKRVGLVSMTTHRERLGSA